MGVYLKNPMHFAFTPKKGQLLERKKKILYNIWALSSLATSTHKAQQIIYRISQTGGEYNNTPLLMLSSSGTLNWRHLIGTDHGWSNKPWTVPMFVAPMYKIFLWSESLLFTWRTQNYVVVKTCWSIQSEVPNRLVKYNLPLSTYSKEVQPTSIKCGSMLEHTRHGVLFLVVTIPFYQ